MDKELLFNYISGHATEAQIKEVMQWAHEDPANMKELETYYQVSVRVEDSSILERRSTCKFMTSDGIDCIMDVLLMGENLS